MFSLHEGAPYRGGASTKKETDHIVESCFKGLARALRTAVEIDPAKAGAVPSTKGVLGGSL